MRPLAAMRAYAGPVFATLTAGRAARCSHLGPTDRSRLLATAVVTAFLVWYAVTDGTAFVSRLLGSNA